MIFILPDTTSGLAISVVIDVAARCGVVVKTVFDVVSLNDDETSDNPDGKAKDCSKGDALVVVGWEAKVESEVDGSMPFDPNLPPKIIEYCVNT